MKKLWLAFLSLLCCAALATPAYADHIEPHARFSSGEGWLYLVIGAAVLAAGLALWMILRRRKK